MELRALRYFVTVAEELHFGRAAERLHIVQPAVSQQIARLERELGTRLLDRSPRTVRLTDAGQRVLDAAREALAAADRVRVAAGDRARTTVRIGTAPGLTCRLERGIDAMRARHAEFEPVLVDLPVGARLAALRAGELDLALARGAVAGPGLRVVPAWSEPLYAVTASRASRPAARETPREDRRPDERVTARIAIADLADRALRLPARECDPPLHDALLSAVSASGVTPRLGRPIGTTQDTVVEIGSDVDSWTLLPAGIIGGVVSTRVRSIPLDPPVTVTGSVITRENDQPACVDDLVEVFRAALEF